MAKKNAVPDESAKNIWRFFGCVLAAAEIAVVILILAALALTWAHSGVSPREVLKIGLLLVAMTLFAVAFLPKTTRRTAQHDLDGSP